MNEYTHGRLSWPTPEQLEPEQRAVYDAIVGGPRAGDVATSPIVARGGRLEGPFNAMLVSPTVGGALQALGSAIRYSTSLMDCDRELAILQVAAHYQSEFEWFAHARVARAAGLDEATLEALHAHQRPRGLTASAELIWSAVHSILDGGDLDDDEYARLSASLSEAGVVELVVLVGYYQALALLLRTFRVPVPVADGESLTDWSQSNGERKL